MEISSGKLHHDLYASWMNSVKAHSQKARFPNLLFPGSFPESITLCLLTLQILMYISDGIGLLGGTINHFADCDDPPKVVCQTSFLNCLPPKCV